MRRFSRFILFGLFGVLASFTLGCSGEGGGGPEVSTPSGLKYVDEKVGTGDEAVAGDVVQVHYTGRLKDGTKFDSSFDHNEPFVFKLGAGTVIKGWDEGVAGMRVGGKRKLIIPPNLAYGDQKQGKIPPNSELTFEIELLRVRKSGS